MGVGLFAGTGGSEADAVAIVPPPAFQMASLTPAYPQSDLELLAPPAPKPPALASLPPLDSFEQSNEPFGVAISALASGALAQKWRDLGSSLRLEQHLLDMCRRSAETCVPAARRFLAAVDAGRAVEGRARIGLINRAINLSIRPVSDLKQYGIEDLWATPLMTFEAGAGDCEDYAIAKYVALREAGIAEKDLRLVVVRDNAVNDFHAVAAVRDNGRWLILDNRTLAIRSDGDIAEFEPLYAMDDTGVRRIAAAVKTAPAVAPAHAGGSDMPLLI